jgi:DNA polymerase/3'-5' exonuclease PolX
MELQQAQEIAQRIRSQVERSASRVEIAGSIRRLKPNVKDVEIVAIVHDYDTLYRELRHHGRFIKPSVPDIIDWSFKPGAKYVRMLLHEGVKLDLFVASPDNWGPLYMMRTGGATGPDGNSFNGFVPGMFARWKKLSGGGMMTGCMPTTKDGIQLACPEEQDFFNLLGMDFVPPEERIDRKVIKKYIRGPVHN